MEILGSQIIPADQQKVWDALNSPAILKACLPGCESVELTEADTFKVVITTAIGPLKAKFKGTLQVTEAVPPQSCVLVFEGQGGAVGFGKGTSSVSLKTVDGGTELSYSAKAHVGGKLAQIGSRLIDSVAKKMSDDFFRAFNQSLTPAPTDDLVIDAIAGEAHLAKVSQVKSANATNHGSTHQNASANDSRVPAWWLIVATITGAVITAILGKLA